MRAGGKLWRRNPAAAPARIAPTHTTDQSAWFHATATSDVAAITTTPLARPSSPSMTLIAFTTATTHTASTAHDHAPSCSGAPPNGFDILSTANPKPWNTSPHPA